jgi:LysM repeat protein
MVLQVDTTRFQSTAGESFRQPVNTFVNPVTVLPRTGMMDLAQALSTVNPVLQQYLGNVIEEEKQKGILQGEIDVLMANPEKLKEFTNALKSKNKNETREILGNNLFVRAGIEKRIAINNGLAIEGKLNEFLNNKTITVEGTNGTVRQVPLKEFSVNSKEFKDAIAEFSETQKLDVTGIRPSFVNQYFMPKVAESVSKAYINQEKNNREFVTEQSNTTLKNNILANFQTIDFTKLDQLDTTNLESNFNIAKKNIQEEINLLDAIGAINSVSPTAMKENVMDIAETIFSTELRKNRSGVVAVQNFRRLVENLKVGPEQTLKDGTKVQANLGQFLGEDWNKMLARFVTNENAYDTFKKKKIAEVIKPRIVNLLDKFEFQLTGSDGTTRYNTEGLEALQALFPNTPEIFLEVIEDVDVSRDQFYDDFAVDIINRNFVSPLEALNRLREFEASLGTTVTDEDTTELNTLKDMIKTYLGKDSLALFRPRINELINQSKDILGGNNLGDQWKSTSTKGKNIELKYYDATNKFNKTIIEIGKKNLDPKTFADEIEKAMQSYAKDILIINDPKTTGSYVLKESGIWSEAQKQLDIQIESIDENNAPTVNENTTTLAEEEKKENNNVGIRDRIRNLFLKPYELSGFSEGGVTTLEVESGDTLSGIANDLDTSVEAIKKANGLTSNTIQIGETLVIPEGITDSSKVNAPEFDMNKIITEKDHPFLPVRKKHNFQVIYNLAKEVGIKFPEVVAAQFGVESVYGSKPTGTNNYLGIKARPEDIKAGNFTEADTSEEIDGKMVKVKAKFKNFNSIKDSLLDYKKHHNDDFFNGFTTRKGTVNVDTAEEAIIRLKENGYATDSDYVKLVTDVLNDAIRDKLF